MDGKDNKAFLVSIKELEEIAFNAGMVHIKIVQNKKRIENLDVILRKGDMSEIDKNHFTTHLLQFTEVDTKLRQQQEEYELKRKAINEKIIHIVGYDE